MPDRSSKPNDDHERWIKNAPPDEQLDSMRKWFLDRYEDPANQTPYDSEDGRYFYPWGGPHDPIDVLNEEFGDLVPHEVIDKLVKELHEKVGDEWAPIAQDVIDYENAFSLDIQKRDYAQSMLRRRMDEIAGTFSLSGNPESKALLLQLAHGATISALEAYLWDLMTYWVFNDDDVFRRLLVTNDDLAKQKMTVGEIFDRYEGLKQEVRDYLESFVWHRLDKVKIIIKLALKIDVPDVSSLMREVVKRHDVIHRGGRTRHGESIEIREQDVRLTMRLVIEFVDLIERQLEPDIPF